jgi:NTP pyrophosphatase (non-canonical NTP hydrolase)
MITEDACICGCIGCSEGNCCEHTADNRGDVGLSFSSYQRGAAVTARGDITLPGAKGRAAIAAMGLAGESGELIDHLKKWVGHGHDLDRTYLLMELGDILWYVAEIATVTGLDLGEVAKINERKLSMRYPKGFSVERSVNRED